MGRIGLLVLLVLALAAAWGLSPRPAPASAREWRPHVGEAAAYAKTRRGSIGFSVRTPTAEWGWRDGGTYPMASLLKPMLMVAYLSPAEVRSRELRAADRALIEPMIRRSDNATASRIVGIVGATGLRRVARAAGMTSFIPSLPTWGKSRTSASDQSRFFLAIESLLPARHRAYAMKQLASIVPEQRWGIARVRLPAGWKLYFKGGWGSGTGWVDHQSALLVHGDERVAVSIMTHRQGSHEYGNETLRGVAKRLLRGLGATPQRGRTAY